MIGPGEWGMIGIAIIVMLLIGAGMKRWRDENDET